MKSFTSAPLQCDRFVKLPVFCLLSYANKVYLSLMISFSQNTAKIPYKNSLINHVFTALFVTAGFRRCSGMLANSTSLFRRECPFWDLSYSLQHPLPKYSNCNMMWSWMKIKMEELDNYALIGTWDVTERLTEWLVFWFSSNHNNKVVLSQCFCVSRHVRYTNIYFHFVFRFSQFAFIKLNSIHLYLSSDNL